MTKEVKWLGSRKCDFCHTECRDDLYDARTVYGPWATMCAECFETYGAGNLGLGRGQHYRKDRNGEFVKVEG